jgi:hypothetical protein
VTEARQSLSIMPRTRLADNEGNLSRRIDLASGRRRSKPRDLLAVQDQAFRGKALKLLRAMERRASSPVGSSETQLIGNGVRLLYPANLAAKASTKIPTMMRYTAKGANPRFRTQAINQATLA